MDEECGVVGDIACEGCGVVNRRMVSVGKEADLISSKDLHTVANYGK